MLRDIEQAMWYLNMAAAAVLFARLYAQGLVRTYPFLFAYLFVDTLEQIVALSFAQNRHIYTEIYFVGQTVKVGLAIFVILELYELALAQQPALARFGRRMLGYVFSIAVAFGRVNLLLEFDGADPERGQRLFEHAFALPICRASLVLIAPGKRLGLFSGRHPQSRLIFRRIGLVLGVHAQALARLLSSTAEREEPFSASPGLAAPDTRIGL